MQEENITEAEFEEINEDLKAVVAEEEPEQQAKLSKQEIVKALAGAVEAGAIGVNRAKQIRQEMGIFQSDFTRTKVSDAKRKAKRKAQKAARKTQRK